MKINYKKGWKYMWILLISFTVVFIGGVMNFIVIVDNGGKMPVRGIYIIDSDEHFYYENKEDVEKWYLSDIMNIGRAAFSIGDIFLLLGTVSFILTAFFMHSSRWGIEEKESEGFEKPKGL
jgi:hypothetical protein